MDYKKFYSVGNRSHTSKQIYVDLLLQLKQKPLSENELCKIMGWSHVSSYLYGHRLLKGKISCKTIDGVRYFGLRQNKN